MRASRWLLALVLGFVFAALAALDASGQSQGLVVRDGSLGSGPLAVEPGLDPLGRLATYLIVPELGEQREGNLFHSFASFSIGAGEVAAFTGPASVSNVIARVTGGDPSQIDGTLRSTITSADLWLLNPSGVVFGEGARLEVPGSFHASTGDYVSFGADGLERFHADPSRPNVLSTASPTAFGFLNESAAASLDVNGAELEVPDGETLELVAGELSLTGAELLAPNGHVSLEAQGEIALSDSLVDAGGDTPGSVSIRAGCIVVKEGSDVLAENTGDAEDAGGTINVAASKSVLVDDSLLSVSTHAAGDAGTIRVESPKVTFQNGPGLLDLTHPFRDPSDPRNQPHEVAVGAAAQTFGSGAGGTIEIDAGSLRVIDGATLAAGSVGSAATGPAGQILITADSVQLEGRAGITAGAWGSQGDGGLVEVHAGTLTLDGTDQYAFIDASINEDLPLPASYAGAPGTIEITAGSIAILNGGAIYNACFQCTSQLDGRPPDAGLTRIQANHMIVDGSNGYGAQSYVIAQNQGTEGDAARIEISVEGALELTNGGSIFDGVGPGASGSGGSITIDAGSLTVSGGAQITAGAARDSSGDAGSITIRAGTLLVEKKGVINTTTNGGGRAGTIDVIATDAILLSDAGGAPFDLNAPLTGIFSATVGGGDAGSVTLEAPAITIADGAIVASSTLFGGGNGGEVTLRGGRIRVGDGAFVDTTSAYSPGRDAGRVTLVASESIEVFGRHPADAAQPSRVASASLGSAGDAGAVTLHASQIVLRDGGRIATNAEAADGGNVTIQANELLYLDRGVITASVTGGAGGNITIDPDFVILRNGSRIEASAGAGTGGQIQITTDNFFAFRDSVVSATAGDPELSGTVEIHSPAVNLAGTLSALPDSLLDAASLMRERCAARRSGERAGSFSVRGAGGIPAEPDGWLRAPMLPEVAATGAAMAGLPALVARLPGALLVRGGCP